jgi:hypothetical protein
MYSLETKVLVKKLVAHEEKKRKNDMLEWNFMVAREQMRYGTKCHTSVCLR